MKKSAVLTISIIFFLLFIFSVNEIIRTVQHESPRSEISDTCGESSDYPQPRSETYDTCGEPPERSKCCCERQLYVETGLFGQGEMKYEEISYEWIDARDCYTRTYYFFFIQKRQAVRYCASDNYCGH